MMKVIVFGLIHLARTCRARLFTVHCGTPLNLTLMEQSLPTLKKISNVNTNCVTGVM